MAIRGTTHPQPPKRRLYSIYAWGTSKKGTIPLSEVLDEATPGGSSSSGMLDRGTKFDYPRELDVKRAFGIDNEGVTVKHMECGPSSSAAILSDGTCLTWGSNDSGQLGHGHKNDVLVPTVLKPPEGSPLSASGVSQIKLGNSTSAIIDTKGDLYTFGFGGSALSGMGCLGHGDADSRLAPALVESLVEDGVYASQVAVGELHMTVLTTEGETLTTGVGSYGRLGNLDTDDQLYFEPVEMLAGDDVVQIAAGLAFTLALTSDGVLHSWGRNDKGQLGQGAGLSVDIYAMEALPRPIESQLEGRRVTKIAAGHSHAAAITADGELFIWGSNIFLEPQAFPSLLHSKMVDVACGENYTVALSEDGRLFTHGKGKTGVLGMASTKNLNQPTLVEGLADRKATGISAGYAHMACWVEDAAGAEAEGGKDEGNKEK